MTTGATDKNPHGQTNDGAAPLTPAPTPEPSPSVQNIVMSAIGLAMLGATAYFLIRTPIACDSPVMIRQFQSQFQDNYAAMVKNWQEKGFATDPIAHLKLNIVSTTTIAREGGWVVCQMKFNHGKPEHEWDFDYMVGKTDDGTLTWRFNGQTPADLQYAWRY